MLKLDAMSEKYTDEQFEAEFKQQVLPAEQGETPDLGPMRAQRWLEDWKLLRAILEEEAGAPEYVSDLHFLQQTHAIREEVDYAVKRRYDEAVQDFEQLHFLQQIHAIREEVDFVVKRRYDAAVQDFEQKKGCRDYVNDLAKCWNVQPHYVWVQPMEVNLSRVEPHRWYHTLLKAYMQAWEDEEKRISDGATVYRYFAYPKAHFDDTDGAADDLSAYFSSSEDEDGERKVGYLLRGGWFCGVRRI